MRRLAVVVVLAAGCGRLGFDVARGPTIGDGAADAPGDGALVRHVGELHADNADQGDEFGSSIAVARDGNTIAIGAPFEDSNGPPSDNSLADSGAVYVFVFDGTAWTQQAYLKDKTPHASDDFGQAVALSADGSTLAVGADRGDTATADCGTVTIFTRTGTTWAPEAVVAASNAAAGDAFGYAVALSSDGNTLVAGAPDEASAAAGIGGNQLDNSAPGAGAAYAFTRAGTVWAQQAYLKASNTGSDDNFGIRVAISDDGNTLAVSARAEASGSTVDQTDNSASGAGAVYILARAGTAWSQEAYVKEPAPTAGNFFGYDVAISGDGTAVIVGSPGADVTIANGGAAYVYVLGTGFDIAAPLAAPNAGNNDQIGTAVAIAGDAFTALAGAALEDSASTDPADNSAPDAGAAYRFARSGPGWVPSDYLKAAVPQAGAEFGWPLAMSANGAVYAIGAIYTNMMTGAVTVSYLGQ